MYFEYNGKTIDGILTVLPKDDSSFEETLLDASIPRARRLKNIMGFDRRRRVQEGTNTSDLIGYGLNYLINNRQLIPESVGAIVVVSFTPDYYVPTVSEILHGRYGFDKETICIDIPQGCTGYIVGLLQAFSLLDHLGDKAVLLCTGDVYNRRYKNEGKFEAASFGGDAATLSVIKNDGSFGRVTASSYTDGSRRNALVMPAGAYAHPVYSAEDAILSDGDSRRNGLGIWMDGSGVFNFIQEKVPPMILDICQKADIDINDIFRFFFHQPNRFILEKVADRAGIPREKLPMKTTEKYGNSNGSSIPVTITDTAITDMLGNKKKCCLSGFGSGLSWASVVMELGEMRFCEQIEADM